MAKSSLNENSIAQAGNPTTIGDLRSTLNGRMNETNKQQTELNRERDQVKGDPLTKPQAEKLAASNYTKWRG